MPSYKLVYFDGKGRGETARMLFALAGQSYEDVRLDFFAEEWREYKPKTPFGQLPLLEINGIVIAQSRALARYLAKTFGFAGKSLLEEALVDMIADTMEDLMRPMEDLYMCKDEGKKAEIKKKYTSETLPIMMANLEKIFSMNNNGSGFFVGDGLTWADLCFINLITWPGMFEMEIPWDKAPKLKALKERVEAVPKIAEWIKMRPETQY